MVRKEKSPRGETGQQKKEGKKEQVSYFAFSMARRDLTAIMTAAGAANATI